MPFFARSLTGRSVMSSPLKRICPEVTIYAGFPVMLVASCFPAFDLPYLSYSTVFMIGLVVYWLVAVARVERAGVSGSQEG